MLSHNSFIKFYFPLATSCRKLQNLNLTKLVNINNRNRLHYDIFKNAKKLNHKPYFDDVSYKSICILSLHNICLLILTIAHD